MGVTGDVRGDDAALHGKAHFESTRKTDPRSAPQAGGKTLAARGAACPQGQV